MAYSHFFGVGNWGYPVLGAGFAGLLLIIVLWSLVWKGIALWHAARNKQTVWYVVMIIVNTAGILEILYLLFWRKDNNHLSMEATVMPPAQKASAPTQTPPSSDSSAPTAG